MSERRRACPDRIGPMWMATRLETELARWARDLIMMSLSLLRERVPWVGSHDKLIADAVARLNPRWARLLDP